MPDEKIPEKLYKYYPFNQRSLEVFINKQLYFSSPDQFNDPFDSTTKIKYEISQDEYIIPNSNNINILNEMAENQTNDMLEYQRNAGIYCLSSNNTNILMWSHYASNHKGFCIEFTDVQQDINKTIFKVKYEKEHPNINYSKKYIIECANCKKAGKTFDPKKILVKTYIEAMTTKFILWEYEKEYRKLESQKELKNFNPEAISSVILGWKMEEAQRRTIANLLKHDEWLHVKFKEAVPIEGKFALRIKDYIP